MELTTAKGQLIDIEADCAVVGVYEGMMESPLPGAAGQVDEALDGQISALIEDGEIRGKLGEITIIHTSGRIAPRRVMVVGGGQADAADANLLRRLAADVARRARANGYKRLTAFRPAAHYLSTVEAAQASAEGALLGLYKISTNGSNSDEGDNRDIESVTFVVDDDADLPELDRGLDRGAIIAEAVALARDLANEPANLMTPTILAQRAKDAADAAGVTFTNLSVGEITEMNMGGLLGVTAGSHEPPAFIILEHRGDPDNKRPTVGLLGKGVTFDSGGISIKPAANMSAMKGDMAGGAAVIGAMQAIGRLNLPINVTGLVPATENLPGGSATKPGDVLTAMNGKTMEVENTDAEGRLILADALSYANSKGMTPLVDVATLTGAIRVALGNVAMGLFANDDDIAGRLLDASKATGEKMWRMPLWDDYKEQIKSSVATVKNTGGQPAGSITAAKFLEEFAEKTPWAHLDIASVSATDRERGWQVRGATGQPVRTLVRLVEDMLSND
ncbi:MAG: leucyl aminopeptidase [Dehalococcoidia bacterium]|nr:leucyl aminopeptidase [Dehalococcoidia bacterium]